VQSADGQKSNSKIATSGSARLGILFEMGHNTNDPPLHYLAQSQAQYLLGLASGSMVDGQDWGLSAAPGACVREHGRWTGLGVISNILSEVAFITAEFSRDGTFTVGIVNICYHIYAWYL
jgi:hypothetical protein